MERKIEIWDIYHGFDKSKIGKVIKLKINICEITKYAPITDFISYYVIEDCILIPFSNNY